MAGAIRIEDLLPALGPGEPEPWIGGTQVEVAARGSIRSDAGERARIARGWHVERVAGALEESATERYESKVGGDERIRIDGTDRLVVDGAARLRSDERQVVMRGRFERHSIGAVSRMAGLDGLIAGGVFLRVQAGASLSLAALATGDVYGAAARVAGVRTQVSGMQYQTSRGTARAAGLYVRATGFVVEPVTGSPGREAPARSVAAKAARIGMIAGSMIPFFGVATAAVSVPVGIARLIRRARGGRGPAGPPGAPRIRTRNGLRVLNGGIEFVS